MRGIIGLAVLCAFITYRQMPVWGSPAALWGHAHSMAPMLPRPMINLAGTRMDVHDYETAETLLWQAHLLALQRTKDEQATAQDLIFANLGLMRFYQGNYRAAAFYLHGAQRYSARGILCDGFPAIRMVCQ